MVLSLSPLKRPVALGPVVIAVMDGIGIGPNDAGNAVWRANAPFLRHMASWPLYRPLQAHGPSVGLLSDSDMGNSEVGHNALGSGQIVRQGASRVADAVATKQLVRGACFLDMVAHLHQTGGSLHLVGLLSDGNVHSHIDHVLALLEGADAAGIASCVCHILLDGRDVARQSALAYLERLEHALARINQRAGRQYRIGSGGGRMHITMDRYGADWPMVERGYLAHVHGVGPATASARSAIEQARERNPKLGDQDLPSFVVCDAQGPVGRMHDGDAVVAFNFRGDRMLELTQAFEAESFDRFDRHTRERQRPSVWFAGMTQYDGDAKQPQRFLVQPPTIRHTLGERLAASNVAQLAVSETQKFGHVTYFWNGNRTGAFEPTLEDYIEVPSLKTPFAEQPKMQAEAIVRASAEALRKRPYAVARLNFANGDMVGHTGDFAATVLAVEAVDQALAQLAKVVVAELHGALVITGDHGNAEDMVERDAAGRPLHDRQGQLQAKTSHSLYPVPLAVLVPPDVAPHIALAPGIAEQRAGLANVAATLATLAGFCPDDLWEPSLVQWRM